MISLWHSPYKNPKEEKNILFITKDFQIYRGYYTHIGGAAGGSPIYGYKAICNHKVAQGKLFPDDNILYWSYFYKNHLLLKIINFIIILFIIPLLIKSIMTLFDLYIYYINFIL